MAFSSSHFLLVLVLAAFTSCCSSGTTNSTLNTKFTVIKSICKSTPYQDLCFDTLKHSISVDSSNPSILRFAVQSIQTAISEVKKLSSLFSNGIFSSSNSGAGAIVEGQRSSIRDCDDLHKITISSLQKSADILTSLVGNNVNPERKKIAEVNTYLSASITNKKTCLEGLSTATGPLKSTVVSSSAEAYKFVSNSLAIVAKSMPPSPARHNRKLMGGLQFPSWLSSSTRRILQSRGGGGDGQGLSFTVSADGSGDFLTVTDAINNVPSYSDSLTFITIKAGVYEENVDVLADKINVVLIGEGRDVTVITGSRNVPDGWTSFGSATVGVSGQGFIARDITIQNSAGAEKGQAVALRVSADLTAFYRCTIVGYQDTLYVHSFRQFYRDCNIFGTVDFIFGNAAVVIQNSNLIARIPLQGQSNVITAQGRDDPNMNTGISIQRCAVLASQELAADPGIARTYLGRPWQPYSRTVFMESYLGEHVDPAGWLSWDGDRGLDTLYYGEYENTGPGSGTDQRVDWPGFHVMGSVDAVQFTVSEFIQGDQWLGSTGVPYDDGL